MDVVKHALWPLNICYHIWAKEKGISVMSAREQRGGFNDGQCQCQSSHCAGSWAVSDKQDQEVLLLPQSPTSLSLVCLGLWLETELIPTSPSLFTNMYWLLCVSDTVAAEDLQLAPAMPLLRLQEVTPLESSDSFTPSASAYLALLTTLICCCMTLQGEMETNMTSLLQ